MDVEAFLAPLDGDSPSGTELRNDARFDAIERMMEPASRASRTDGDGNVNAMAQVDWSDAFEQAKELAATGRDLRLLVNVVRSMVNLEGFAGLAEGLDMLTKTVEQYWDSVHPELRDRPDPGEAALRRLNALKDIQDDDNGVLGDLMMGAIFDKRPMGPVTGNDLAKSSLSEYELLQAAPGMSAEEEEALKARHEERVNRVTAACRALFAEDTETAQAILDGAAAADAARVKLETTVTETAGLTGGIGLKLSELETFLAQVQKTLQAAAGAAAGAAAPTEPAAAPDAGGGAPAARAQAAPAASGAPGRVNSRSDVEKCLDMIIEFYERTEPSSPIPHLAKRMRRMVPMNFMQLMEEVAPTGMKEFRVIAGVDDKSK